MCNKNDDGLTWPLAFFLSVIFVGVFALVGLSIWISRAHAAEPQKCYLVDPQTNYCITGVNPHVFVLPTPYAEKKQSAEDRHIDLPTELAKLRPTDPVCHDPFPVPCP